MEDLFRDAFFDSRYLEFIGKLLRGQNATPLTGTELLFSRQAHILRELNDESYDGQLIQELRSYSRYVPVQDAIRFLVEARRYGVLIEAIDVLKTSVREGKGGTYIELVQILEQAQTIPTEWAVVVYGEEVPEREEKTYKMPSGLNFEAMNNFK